MARTADAWPLASIQCVNRKPKSLWWSTWPGALGLGLASALMVVAGSFTTIVYVLLTADVSGTDKTATSTGPNTAVRIVGGVLAIAMWALPVLTVVWARRKWLGYLLLGLALSVGCFVLGLGMMGIV